MPNEGSQRVTLPPENECAPFVSKGNSLPPIRKLLLKFIAY